MKKSHHSGFRGRLHIRKSWMDKMADMLTNWFGTPTFFIGNALIFGLWILINTNLLPIVPVFDPFPFNLLTMIVSLEAIFLSIIVLISQNKAGTIADMRDEIDFEINVRAENEVTKILTMLERISHHLKISTARDEELKSMKQPTDLEKISKELSE